MVWAGHQAAIDRHIRSAIGQLKEGTHAQWGVFHARERGTDEQPGGNGGQAGEQVYFTYHPQMLLKTAVGSTTYLEGADYDAAGRANLFSLVRFIRPNSDLEFKFGAQAQPDPIQALKANLIYGGYPD